MLSHTHKYKVTLGKVEVIEVVGIRVDLHRPQPHRLPVHLPRLPEMMQRAAILIQRNPKLAAPAISLRPIPNQPHLLLQFPDLLAQLAFHLVVLLHPIVMQLLDFRAVLGVEFEPLLL